MSTHKGPHAHGEALLKGITVQEMRPVAGMSADTVPNPDNVEMIMERWEISPEPVVPGRAWADGEWALVIEVEQEIPHWL